MPMNLPIALFDSGVGGLTVFKAIKNLMPNESLIYLGDTARLPYGTKSRETITRYTLKAAGKLVQHKVKLLVVACNTATAAALPELERQFAPMPVIGVIAPGAKAAGEASRNGHIAVIATEATVRENSYPKAIALVRPEAKVISQACTLFVAIAEEGWAENEVALAAARKYLADIFPQSSDGTDTPDTLLLGCTHFPLLLQTLEKVVSPGVRIVDSATATASAARKILEERSLLSTASEGEDRFLTTDNPGRFAKVGSHFLGRKLLPGQIELVDL